MYQLFKAFFVVQMNDGRDDLKGEILSNVSADTFHGRGALLLQIFVAVNFFLCFRPTQAGQIYYTPPRHAGKEAGAAFATSSECYNFPDFFVGTLVRRSATRTLIVPLGKVRFVRPTERRVPSQPKVVQKRSLLIGHQRIAALNILVWLCAGLSVNGEEIILINTARHHIIAIEWRLQLIIAETNGGGGGGASPRQTLDGWALSFTLGAHSKNSISTGRRHRSSADRYVMICARLEIRPSKAAALPGKWKELLQRIPLTFIAHE